jgi:tetratricopeptide (TPR) repeat protein
MENSNQALEDYLKGLEFDPDSLAIRLRAATILLQKSDPINALPHLERLIKQYPDNAEVMARMGQCRVVRGENEQARPLLEAAVQSLPDDLDLLHDLAKVEMAAQNFRAAEEWLRKALKEDEADVEGLWILHNCLQFQGRKKEAEEVLEIRKKKAELLKDVNDLLREEGNHPKPDPDRFHKLGVLLIQVGRAKVGLTWLDKALKINPEHQPAHRDLAEFFERRGNPGDREQAQFHRRHLIRVTKKPAASSKEAKEQGSKERIPPFILVPWVP